MHRRESQLQFGEVKFRSIEDLNMNQVRRERGEKY